MTTLGMIKSTVYLLRTDSRKDHIKITSQTSLMRRHALYEILIFHFFTL